MVKNLHIFISINHLKYNIVDTFFYFSFFMTCPTSVPIFRSVGSFCATDLRGGGGDSSPQNKPIGLGLTSNLSGICIRYRVYRNRQYNTYMYTYNHSTLWLIFFNQLLLLLDSHFKPWSREYNKIISLYIGLCLVSALSIVLLYINITIVNV